MQSFRNFPRYSRIIAPVVISRNFTQQSKLVQKRLPCSFKTFRTLKDINTNKSSLQYFIISIPKASMSSSSAPLAVEHDPSSNKFFIRLGSDEAKLEYSKDGNTLDMWHTEVPPALQGKGIAKILAKEAFDFVVKNNLKMRLTCSYLQKYYQDNPKDEYKSLVV